MAHQLANAASQPLTSPLLDPSAYLRCPLIRNRHRPGLAPHELNEDRDLRSIADLRAVLAGVLVEHLQFPRQAVADPFPITVPVRPLSGLIRA
jgi:hypothetical protein